MYARGAKVALAVLVVSAATWLLFPGPIGRLVIAQLSKPYAAPSADTAAAVLHARDDVAAATQAGDVTAATAVVLQKLADGFTQPTDVQFVPGSSQRLVVLEKTGAARWLDLADDSRGTLFELPVRTESEEGLLGLAFHPRFADNGRFYVHYTPAEGSKHRSRIARFTHSNPADFATGTAQQDQVLLEVLQPYQNHNAGQLAFGPDGMLYIGMGDGGLADDPEGNGQDVTSLLGKMLRVEVDAATDGRPYAIPPDNPFLNDAPARPELWAVGLRNPWRFTFAPDGRMIVADVGQDAWEEIDIVSAGDNLGWSVREGLSCFDGHADCGKVFVDPIHVYGRDVGQSVTGGHVYDGKAIGWLRGHYVFADFISGRFFALKLPAARQVPSEVPSGGLPALPLGRWPVLPSAFGIDADGELYVAAYGHGILYKLTPQGGAAVDAAGEADGASDDAGAP